MRACLIIPTAGLLALASTPSWAEGLLYVASTPPGAQIVVDGKLTSQRTPVQLLLTGGVHRIAVMKAGHEVSDQRIKVVDGKVVRLQLTLTPAVRNLAKAPPAKRPAKGKRRRPLVTGSITLITDVIGADIALDGKPTRLKTPITVRVPIGRHTIRLSYGNAFVDQTVTIHKGNNAQIRVNLKPHLRKPAAARKARPRGSADPTWPARHQACVKRCKYKAFIKTCDGRWQQCVKGCPGQVAGRIVNPGYYHPCKDTCSSRRQYCLDSSVSACRTNCDNLK